MTQSSGRPSPAETITRAIIDRLEAGVRPWVRPWRSCAAQGRPLRANGEPCDPEEEGELVHRGALVSLGYWNDPEKTATRFRPAPGRPIRR